jgi:enoyl-CoA hydratase
MLQAQTDLQLNALCSQLVDELVNCLESLDQDPSVGCIVLTGNSKAFAAGADIAEMANMEYIDVFQGGIHQFSF